MINVSIKHEALAVTSDYKQEFLLGFEGRPYTMIIVISLPYFLAVNGWTLEHRHPLAHDI